MIPLSCANCWFNALQTESVGPAVGYCTRHEVMLLAAERTTCGQQIRKDLMYPDAVEEQEIHRTEFSQDKIVTLFDRSPANGEVSRRPNDLDRLAQETVGEIVLDYGQLHSTIESLSRLREVPGARAELAMLTLARGYVHNCVRRGGSWTSGIHLFWWTRKRLAHKVELSYEDLRHLWMPLDRQMKLAEWSLVMLRIYFISDIAHHAKDHELSALKDLPDEVALEVDRLEPGPVLHWIRRKLIPRIDKLLPYEAYSQLARDLHREPVAV